MSKTKKYHCKCPRCSHTLIHEVGPVLCPNCGNGHLKERYLGDYEYDVICTNKNCPYHHWGGRLNDSPNISCPKCGTSMGVNLSLSSACYIATLVYGSYDSSEVKTLRKFRDNYLLERSWGRKFIKFYYTYGPMVAKKLENRKILNRIIKKILDFLVLLIKQNYN